MPPDNLYRRIYEQAQRRRQQGPQRLAQQIQRIEDKAQRDGEQTEHGKS